MPKKGIKSSDSSLSKKEKNALENDLKHFGYLLPTNEEELEEFEKIYGTTQVMFPEHLKNPDFLFKKKAIDSPKLTPVKKDQQGQKKKVAKKTTAKVFQVNDYFKKLVLSAEIAYQLYQEPTFGHVKFVKIRYLCEEVCNMQLNSNYGKYAAGPLDTKSMYSTDAEFKKRKWFDVKKTDYGYRYEPLDNIEEYKKYYLKYFSDKSDNINEIINLLRKEKTDFCEIVATLYAVWKEKLSKVRSIDDTVLINGFYGWSESKKRFKEQDINKALNWMRNNQIVPIR